MFPAIGEAALEILLMVCGILLASTAVTGIVAFCLAAKDDTLDSLWWLILVLSASALLFPVLLYVYIVG